MSFNRRHFLKWIALAAGGQVFINVFPVTQGQVSGNNVSVGDEQLTDPAYSWGMLIDLDLCIGCQSCSMACKEENGTPLGIDWHIVREATEDEYPNIGGAYLPLPCMHCQEAPCVEVCPVRATYNRGDGLVVQDYRICIGCRYCQAACPYGRRYFNWKEPDNSRAEPEVEQRRRGVIEKCTFCIHRIDSGLKKGLMPGKDREATPACIDICPVEARIFGNLNDKQSRLVKYLEERRPQPLMQYLGTRPRVYYVPPRGRRPGPDWRGDEA